VGELGREIDFSDGLVSAAHRTFLMTRARQPFRCSLTDPSKEGMNKSGISKDINDVMTVKSWPLMIKEFSKDLPCGSDKEGIVHAPSATTISQR